MIGGPPAPRSRRLYRLLLGLYPPALRDGFADVQADAFEDWLSEARARQGLAGVAGVWGQAALDWSWSMLLAYRDAASPAGAAQLISGLLLALALGMWSLIGASMLGHVAWATDFVETHTTPNTWMALGAPCAALVLAAMVNPWRSGRLTPLLKLSAAVCGSAWSLAVLTWRG